MASKIDVYGPVSKITGDFPIPQVRKATSYPVEGAQFSQAFKKKVWDGRKHLFRLGTNTFPTGLLDIVIKACKDNDHDVIVDDHRIEPKAKNEDFTLEGATFDYPYDYQLDACKQMVEHKQGIVKAATNSGKTEIACAVTKYLGLKTLFVVTTQELLHQGQQRFMKRLGVNEDVVGVVGDGRWEPGSWVTIATIDTLESRIETEECRELLAQTQVLFLDECHHAGSNTFYDVCILCPAYYRFGLSGTPLNRTDGANLRLIALTGDIIVDIGNKFLVDRGISAKADIVFTRVTEPALPPKLVYESAYKQGVVENPVLLSYIVDWTKVCREVNLSVLILVEHINHGKLVDEALWNSTDGVFIPHVFLHGSEDSETRKTSLNDFAEKRLPVLIASSILDEGVDVPTIDVLIVAGSRKSKIKTLQRLGRGLRGKKLILIEFCNFTNDYLLRHSLQRYEDYKAEDCFTLHQSRPDKALIEKLWTK